MFQQVKKKYELGTQLLVLFYHIHLFVQIYYVISRELSWRRIEFKNNISLDSVEFKNKNRINMSVNEVRILI